MEETGVRQRKPQSEKAAQSADVELKPDWAFAFSRADKELQKHVGQALASLSDIGFYVAVRNGAKGTVVVLARAGPGLLNSTSTRTIGVSRWVPQLDGVVDSFPIEATPVPSLLSQKPFLTPHQLDEIESHYGGSVAALYDYLNFLQRGLIVPAVLGVATYFTVGSFSLVYTVVVLAWGVLLVARWQNVVEPAVNVSVPIETRRPGYRGTAVTVRERRKLLFGPFAFVLLVFYAVGLLAVLGLEVFCTHLYDGPLKAIVALVPIGANITASIVYGFIYQWAIDKFTAWEDYATEEDLHEVEAQRAFYLNALLGYTPILLTAFVYLPFGNRLVGVTPVLRRSKIASYVRLVPEFKLNTKRLLGQAVFYSVQNQLISLVVGAGVPSALYAFRRYVLKRAEPADRDSFVLQQLREPFDVDAQVSALVLAFGYILLLAPVWPLAALAALVGVYVRSRASLYMLTRGTRKSVNRRGRTLGFWNRDLSFMVIFAAAVAPAMSVMFGNSTSVYSLSRSLVDVPALIVVFVALVSENSALIFQYVANKYFSALPSASSVPKRPRVFNSPDQDKLWRTIDVTADLRRVFPEVTR